MSVSVANTDAQLSGKTLMTLDANQTITGLKTYDRGTSAPFAIVSGAAVVTNLDADKLDGLEGSAYAVLAAVSNAFTGSGSFTGTLGVTGAFSTDSNVTAVGHIGITSGSKYYLDGVGVSGDTYLTESSANVARLVVGGVNAIEVSATAVAITDRVDVTGPTNATAIRLNSSRTTSVLVIDGNFETQITGIDMKSTEAATGGTFIAFTNSSGNAAGSITHNGTTTTAYNTSSDARLKRDHGVVTQTDVLARSIVRDFEWLADGTRDRGVFAQEAQLVHPRAVSVARDEMGTMQVDYSKYVPDLIVGWQQHDAMIQQLIARIAMLEARH